MLDNYDGMLSLFLSSIELVLIINVLIFSQKNSVNKLMILLLALLFAYQTTEFIICGLNYKTSLHAYVALMIVTFMPPLSLHIILRFYNYNLKFIHLLYFPAIFFTIYYLFFINQFEVAKCTVVYAVYHYPLGFIYGVFYYLPILLVLILLSVKIKNKVKLKQTKILFTGYAITFIPAFLFTRLVPGMMQAVESIICTFAFILALFLTYFILKNK